ncbi:MAG: hypothetical protein MJ108_09285 [Saccharofermentans sp.]|nr:hypothetical protein [Saccharofermentans sp.]
MKKIIVVILTMMMLVFAGCANKEVKNVETLIDEIGEVSIDSSDKLEAAQNAYDALSPEDAQKVSNYNQLLSAQSEYDGIVDETISNANSLYSKVNKNLENYERNAAIENLDELQKLYDSIPEDRKSEVKFSTDIAKLRDALQDVCYPNTEIWKFHFVAGGDYIGIDENDVAPKYKIQVWYSYSTGNEAVEACLDYIDYLDKQLDVKLESIDKELSIVTYSYPGGHIEVFPMNFGSQGGQVSVGLY